MAILALTTSGPTGEVALALEGRAPAVVPLAAGRDRGRDVLPAVRRLLREYGLVPADLRGLAVDLGPGSFTGVRVGVTVAKTLAWALGRPVVGVDSLALLAAAADPGVAVLAVRDAGRGTLYHAAFGPGPPGARPPLHPPGRAPARDLGTIARGARPVGEEAPAIAARSGWGVAGQHVVAGAQALLTVAVPRLARGATQAPHDLAPCYLQASAPERRAAGEAP